MLWWWMGSVVALWAPAVSARGVGDDEGEPVKIEVMEASRPTVRVRPDGDGLRLPACRGVVWERFDPELGRYQQLDAAPCGPLEPARVLPADGLESVLDPVPASGAIVRVVVVVGVGCQPDQPFALAGCEQITEVTGPQMQVGPGAEGGP